MGSVAFHTACIKVAVLCRVFGRIALSQTAPCGQLDKDRNNNSLFASLSIRRLTIRAIPVTGHFAVMDELFHLYGKERSKIFHSTNTSSLTGYLSILMEHSFRWAKSAWRYGFMESAAVCPSIFEITGICMPFSSMAVAAW